ncbi:carbohydrate esterase family 5 protein [Xylariaceae sp. FL1019]|nr:carbohydrate esterase family 5 protein [Xylariaceae sp. FL1019]
MYAVLSLLLLGAIIHLTNGQLSTCPEIHIFGARETTAPPGFGSSSTVVALIQQAYPSATNESIIYPAAGENLYGGSAYGASVAKGVAAVAKQTNLFFQKCPDTTLVIVGYSQGAQIVDDAFCGGPDAFSLDTTKESVSAGVSRMTSAIILMGNPRNVPGRKGNVGNATVGGFAARPLGFQCPAFDTITRSYCDAADPFCAKGDSAATHQGYGREYGHDALDFVTQKLGRKPSSASTSLDSKSGLMIVAIMISWSITFPVDFVL